MQIHYLAIDEIKEYENNPRINDGAVEAVAASISNFGFRSPIIIDKNNVIIAGHTRLKAAQKMKFHKVPCIIAEDLLPDQVKAFRLADNKVGEIAEWDLDKLEMELSDLNGFDFDMVQFGFDDIDFEEPFDVIEDEVPEVDEENEPITKPGDVWQLGRHRLMCGDSTDKQTVEKLMNGQKANMLLTDPPYNVAYEGKTKEALTIENDNMSNDEFKDFLIKAFYAADNVLVEGGAFYIWHADSEGYNFRGACFDIGWQVRQCLIWNKNSMVLGRQDYQWKHEPCLYGWKSGASHNWFSDRSQTTVLNFDKPLRNGEHPTMKPIALFDYQIKNSTQKGEIILDVFAGSGTTLIACEQNGRNAYVMELDPKYCDVIVKRWENLTGEQAVLLEKNHSR